MKVLFLFSIFFCVEAFSSVSVFRLADKSVFKKERSLGHCTAFLFERNLYTAAHCNHFKDFVLLDEKGDFVFDLSGYQKFYLKKDNGLYDVLKIPLPVDVQPHLEAKGVPSYSLKSLSILGFPKSFAQHKKLTHFECASLDEKSFVGIEYVESLMGVKHFSCTGANHDLPNSVELLPHSKVAGLSGGLVLKGKKVLGLVYHYTEVKKGGLADVGVFKALDFKKGKYISEARAIRDYQLKKKPLEQVKQPNKTLIDLVVKFQTAPVFKSAKLQDLKKIEKLPDGKARYHFSDQVVEF